MLLSCHEYAFESYTTSLFNLGMRFVAVLLWGERGGRGGREGEESRKEEGTVDRIDRMIKYPVSRFFTHRQKRPSITQNHLPPIDTTL